MKAVWNGQIIAESDDTVVVEGNHYFPLGALNREFVRESTHSSYCPWKGEASYFSLEVDGQVNRDAAWHYPTPKPKAEQIRGRWPSGRREGHRVAVGELEDEWGQPLTPAVRWSSYARAWNG